MHAMQRFSFAFAGRLMLAAAALLAAGCGGGSDSATSSSTAQPPAAALPTPGAGATTSAPAAGTSTVPAPTVIASAGADCGLAGFQAAMLARVNYWRAAGASCRTAGVFAATTPLAWNSKLLQAATGHSQDMITHNYFSHTSFDGRTLVQRVNATGYAWLSIGENIAAGQQTVLEVVDGWMGSDGHCENIMNPAFKEIAVACLPGGATNTYKTYWTMDLGKPA